MALADAGIVMKDLVSAVAIGRVDDRLVVDLDYNEEAYEEGRGTADIPVAILPNSGKISLLQMDGQITREELKECLRLAKDACKRIYEVQKSALKEKYIVSGE
jgi:exosome complex component RRP41